MTNKTYLYNILDVDLLRNEITAGFVTERHHPIYDQLRILNYTPETQYAKRWNAVTRLTRGLIYDCRDALVLARPFPKIHNWDEPEAPQIDFDGEVTYWGDKWDGSLGIVYRTPHGELAVATRGSFSSDQAIHANSWFLDSATDEAIEAYEWSEKELEAGRTPLFEIIYPQNRIVVDYKDLDQMIPLGSIDNATGNFTPKTLQPQKKFSDLRSDLFRANSEGWVVWSSPTSAVKIKQADYVELHRIVSNLSEKEIWRQKVAGTFDTFLLALPDEFYDWATKIGATLQNAFDEEITGAAEAAAGVLARGGTRREQALYIQATYPVDQRGAIFASLDGKVPTAGVWKKLEPVGTGSKLNF